MGSHQSFGQDPTLSCKQIDTEPNFSILESQSGQQYQKYLILHDNTPHFQQQYHFRIANPHQDLVQVKYAGKQRDIQGQIATFMGCAERSKYEVVTERIPYLIESMTDLRVGNALVVLKGSLRGFKDLHRRHGGIAIKENMIGINEENKVKAWLNENFAVNRPEENEEDQGKMVERIFEMLGGKVQRARLWEELMAMKAGTNTKTFQEALAMLQDFTKRRQIHIEDTVSNIFNKSYYQEKQVDYQEPFQYIQTEHSVVLTSPARKPFEEMDEKILQSKTQPFNFTLAKQENVEFQTPQQRIINPLFVRVEEQRQSTPVFHQPVNRTERMIVRNAQQIQVKFSNKVPQQVRVVPLFSSTSNNIFQTHQRKEENKAIIEVKTIQTSESANNLPHIAQKPKETAVTVPTFSAIPTQNQSNAIQNQQQSQHADTSFQKEEDQGLYTQPQSPKAEKEQIFVTLNNSEYVRVEPSYEVNVQEAVSEQSIHEQLTPLLADESAPQSQQNFQEEGRTALQVYLNSEQASLHHLQSIRTSLNPSLVDTRQIKQVQNPKPEPLPVPKSLNLSYRQMRKLLLQQLQ